MRDATGAYRVIYLATRPEAIYVLHCFQKKTQKTRKQDTEVAARRLSQIGDWAMRKRNVGHTTPANRSVFRDLGFDEAEARVLEMRADLMTALREQIKAQRWTQSQAAKRLGITQPRVSALVKGVWRDFSADMLLVLAARVGLRPTLELAA